MNKRLIAYNSRKLPFTLLVVLIPIFVVIIMLIINAKELFHWIVLVGVIFDLCGWHNKSYCLYEYFLSVIQTELAKHDYKKIKKPIFVKNVENLTLTVIYKNKKKKVVNLIKNNKTTLTIKFKNRFSVKCDILGSKKVCLKDLYEFNI